VIVDAPAAGVLSCGQVGRGDTAAVNAETSSCSALVRRWMTAPIELLPDGTVIHRLTRAEHDEVSALTAAVSPRPT